MAIALFSGSERVTAEGQGSKNVPSNRQGQVLLALGKLLSWLACPMGRGTNKPPPLTGSRKLVKNKKLINLGAVVPKIKHFPFEI